MKINVEINALFHPERYFPNWNKIYLWLPRVHTLIFKKQLAIERADLSWERHSRSAKRAQWRFPLRIKGLCIPLVKCNVPLLVTREQQLFTISIEHFTIITCKTRLATWQPISSLWTATKEYLLNNTSLWYTSYSKLPFCASVNSLVRQFGATSRDAKRKRTEWNNNEGIEYFIVVLLSKNNLTDENNVKLSKKNSDAKFSRFV